MSAFILIIKKIIRPNNNIFSIDYDKSDKINNIIKILFSNFCLNEINIQSKLEFFFEIINNTFLKNITDEFIQHFCKIQRTYTGFNRLAQVFKYKKSNIVVNCDIGLNEINEKQKHVITILQSKSKYLFAINDIINIINTSLTNNFNFFAEPLCIKNPYNNIPFSKSTLYNIYFFILYKTYYRPELFFNFFSCDFNLSSFGKKYEILLREKSIENYVYKSPSNILHTEIIKMINFYNKYYSKFNLNNKIYIDVDFPKDKLITIMKPYLLLYFNSLYSLIPERKSETELIFKNMMIRFNKFNPQFGRKKYKIALKHTKDFKRKIIGKITEFDDRHITFNKPQYNSKHFLTDHLEYVNNYNMLNVRLNNFLIIIDESHYYFNNNEHEEDYNSNNNQYNVNENNADDETYTNDEETENNEETEETENNEETETEETEIDEETEETEIDEVDSIS